MRIGTESSTLTSPNKKKNLKLHLANSKSCRAKYESSQPAKPIPRTFDLDDPEDGGDGDEPEGLAGEGTFNTALDHLFPDFLAAVCSPDDEEMPVDPHNANEDSTDHLSPGTPSPDFELPPKQCWTDPEVKTWVQDFPTPAGTPGDRGATEFEVIEKVANERGWGKWGPFESEKEWELARWLFKNSTQSRTDEFLKMDIVST